MDEAPSPQELAQLLAIKLEHLLGLPIRTSEDREHWHVACFEVDQWLTAHRPLMVHDVPYTLEHFFADADIRARDAGYRVQQETEVRQLIEQLREWPTSKVHSNL